MDAEERIKVMRSRQRLVHNSVKKLQTREINSSKRYRGFNFTKERFRNIKLQAEYDTYDLEEQLPFSFRFLNQRSKIIKLFMTGDVVFALAQAGLCTAFSRETRKRICFLNVSPCDVIKRLFYNGKNDSVITISRCALNRISSLIYRTTSIKYIRRGEPNAGFRLLELGSTQWPDILEFYDVNGKIRMYFSEDKTYKVFDLKNYALLYSVTDKKIQDIKISPGFLVLVYKKYRSVIPLKIVSVEDGTIVKSFRHQLHKNKKVRNSEVTEVSKTEFLCPFSFIFWHKNQLFLAVTNHAVIVWNLRGKLVTSLYDHIIWFPYPNTNKIYITSNGDFIITSPFGNDGSINIINILRGKCVRRIMESMSKRIKDSRIRSSVGEALEDITFLTYDEERNEIFTGNRLGQVHVWTN